MWISSPRRSGPTKKKPLRAPEVFEHPGPEAAGFASLVCAARTAFAPTPLFELRRGLAGAPRAWAEGLRYSGIIGSIEQLRYKGGCSSVM
jgi:hypothetical protein